MSWLSSLPGAASTSHDDGNDEDGIGSAQNHAEDVAAQSSVSISSAKVEREVAAFAVAIDGEPPVSGQEVAPEALAWLADLGFDESAAKAALLEARGDSDDALRMLQQADASSPSPSKKRRAVACGDEFELEGFVCRVRGKQLVLRPPCTPGIDGPVVGKVQVDGSVAFDGVSEWVRELYEAKALRCASAYADVQGLASFDSTAAVAACQDGAPWIWNRFASQEEVVSAHAELEDLLAKGQLRASAAATTSRSKSRSDRVCFVDITGTPQDDRLSCPPNCLRLFRRLEAATSSLQWPEQDGFGLFCPQLGMVSVYDGEGSHYTSHRDNQQRGDGSWVNFRMLTALAYVNPSGFDGSQSDGGELRCHVGASAEDLVGSTAVRVVDILPRGGTAVLFPSRDLLHEVLPSRRRRFALSLWLLSPA